MGSMLRGTNCAPSQTGAILDRVSRVFFSVVQADTNPERQKIQEDVVPKLAAHGDAIHLDAKLFAVAPSSVEEAVNEPQHEESPA